MRTVNLTSGQTAIKVQTTTYLTKNTMTYILADVVFNSIEGDVVDVFGDFWGEEFDQEKIDKYFNDYVSGKGKREILRLVKEHIQYQGTTVYSDWYEDTNQQPVINRITHAAFLYVSKTFPELTN